MKIIITLIVMSFGLCLADQKQIFLNLDIPGQLSKRDPELTPVGYLMTLSVKENLALQKEDQIKLLILFRDAAKITREKYGQDMAIDTNMPVYRLLKIYFPKVDEKERESKAMVFLGDVDEVLENYQREWGQ